MQKTQVQSLDWEDALEEEMATHSCILAGKSHRQRNLEGHSPWGHKESDICDKGTNPWDSLVAQLVKNPITMWEDP